MSADVRSVPDLLKVGEDEFDTSIKAMTVKNLMDVISALQREMAREQEAFNSLSGELQKSKGRNSRQSKQISKDMVASQQRLTLLMNRSMKCFAQQNSPHSNSNGGDGAAGGLRRRNSAKGPSSPTVGKPGDGPGSTSNTRSSAIYRSRSMHSVNQPSPMSSPSAPQPPSLIASSSNSSSSASSSSSSSSKPKGSGSTVPVISKPLLAYSNATGARVVKNKEQDTKVADSKSTGYTPVIKTSSSSSAEGQNGKSTDAQNSKDTTTEVLNNANTQGVLEGSRISSGGGSNGADKASGGGGLYIKRRFGQPVPRPLSTPSVIQNFNMSTASSYTNATNSSQPANNSSSTSTSPSSPPTSSISTNFTIPSSTFSSGNRSHPAYKSCTASRVEGKPQVVGSTRPTSSSTANTISPMLLSQPLSKSQGAIHNAHHSSSTTPVSSGSVGDDLDSKKDGENGGDEFQGLPSVRQLAQSFGSMSALNTTSGSSSTSNYSSRNPRQIGGAASTHTSSLIFSPGKGVSRSASSVGFLRARPNSSNPSSDSPPSSSSGSLVSSQRLFLSNKSGNKNTTTATNSSNGQASAVRQGTDSVPNQQPSTLVHQQPAAAHGSRRTTPVSSSSFSVSASSSDTNQEAQNPLALARARLKNRSAREAALVPKAEPNISPTTAASASTNATTPAAATNYTSSTTSFSTAPEQPVILQAKPTATLYPSSSTDSQSPPSSSQQPFAATSATSSIPQSNLWRSKSKDGLAAQAQPQTTNKVPRQPLFTKSTTASNKDSLLKQIQARRRYDDDDDVVDGSEGNIRTVSKLSMSMPSLLQPDLAADPNQGDGSRDRPIKSSVVLPPKSTTTTGDVSSSSNSSGAVAGAPDGGTEGGGDDDDTVETTTRMNLRDWDPSPVLKKVYEVKLMDEQVEDISHQFISMEGLMEKLPMNKKKATLLKTWKRRFFKAKDGWLYYYETSNRDRPSETIQLMGGTIMDLGNRVLGIDDGRGRYLMVRCPTEKEHGQWVVALESQTADNTKATYVRPALAAARHTKKKVVVIDLGSSAIRAGVLGDRASLPEVFIPSVVAVDQTSGKVLAVGHDAFTPFMRHKCRLVQPIRPTNKVDQFNIEVDLMGAIFNKVFQELNVKPSSYWVMLSTPQSLGDPLKKGLMERLVDELNVAGVCMVQQALLSLYSYNATSGIIVDIGHRIEILPIFDGFVIEGGVARCPYGAQKVQESLNISLLHSNYKFHSQTEQLLLRYIMEQSCYVALDYKEEEEFCKEQPQTIRSSVNFARFKLPEGSYEGVQLDLSRFKSPEGFFNVDMWEMDYPTLHKLIHRAIQSCPMDNRRHMWRAVFLSGGCTMLPGFAERLEKELTKLAPPGVPVEVHAAPQRYHAAFVGACSVALMPQFEASAISREEWKKEGGKAFRKWQAPS